MKLYRKKIWAMAVCTAVLTATACGESAHPSGAEAMWESLDAAMDAAASKEESEFQAAVEDSKDGIMRISSSGDLVKFRERVKAGEIALGAILTDDIDMSDICSEAVGSWEPIAEYAGTFDGDNHSIKNLYINGSDISSGLFGTTTEGSLIKNVTMEDFVITSSGHTGSLIGWCSGTIENCHSNGQLTATGNISGGVCGVVIGEADLAVIGCSNRGTVIGVDTTVGGVIGQMGNGTVETSSRIEKCWNEGSVESTGKYAGGVIGQLGQDDRRSQVTAADCYNTGSVTNETLNAGGIAGRAYNFTITRCYNTGDISAASSAGGIVASGITNKKSYEHSVIENCYNKGRISAINWTGYFSYGKTHITSQDAAGIAVAIGGGIVNCYNDGEISVSAEKPLEGRVAGVGAATVTANCYSHGRLVAAEESMKSGIGSMSGTMSGTQDGISIFYLEGTENNEPGSPETFFTDGSLLSELQAFSPDSIEDDSYKLELSAWVQGENGLPRFDWE